MTGLEMRTDVLSHILPFTLFSIIPIPYKSRNRTHTLNHRFTRKTAHITGVKGVDNSQHAF